MPGLQTIFLLSVISLLAVICLQKALCGCSCILIGMYSLEMHSFDTCLHAKLALTWKFSHLFAIPV